MALFFNYVGGEVNDESFNAFQTVPKRESNGEASEFPALTRTGISAQSDSPLKECNMKETVVTPTSVNRAVQPGNTPTASNNIAKPGVPPTVGRREMENKTVTPTSLNRSGQANAKPTASNNVAKPGATPTVGGKETASKTVTRFVQSRRARRRLL
jgi:hypothetical protein